MFKAVKSNSKIVFTQVLIIDLTSVPYLDQTACKAFIEWVGSVDEKAHISLVAPEGQFLIKFPSS